MERITLKRLEAVIERLNRELGRPLAPYTRKGGKLVANVGNFHLSGAYGGWQVCEMCNEAGGVRHACDTYGFAPKREVYDKVQATLAGIELARRNGVAA